VSCDKSTITSALRHLSTGNDVVPFQLGDNVYKLLVYDILGSCGAPYSERFLSNENPRARLQSIETFGWGFWMPQ